MFQSTGTSHGFDNYRANMFRHLTHLKNNHEQKDTTSHVKQVNNWMELSGMNLKAEQTSTLSHTNDHKYTPQRTTSPKPFTSDPPDSASVHKPQPMKSGSTPPHYENQEEFDAYSSKSDAYSAERNQSLNHEKGDKSQFSFKSWLKREPGKRHHSGESKSSGEEKKLEQSVDLGKRQQGETALSKLKHSVVQKFSSSTSTSKNRQQQSVQNTYVSTEQSYQSSPSYVPLNLNVNDIDPYETSLGRESRFGTMSSEIDLRPRIFDKGHVDDSDIQVNSAERRSKFDSSKFSYKNVKTRQGSDISTEYASLYHTPPFFSPPATHIDKDGYASPITLNSSSKSDINNNETKNRFQGSDVPPRNRAPLALGSNMSISDAYKKDTEQTGAKRFQTEGNESSNRSTFNSHHSNISRSGNFSVETPTSRNIRMDKNETIVKSSQYLQSFPEQHTNEFGKPPLQRRTWETPPVKPERTLERYPASQNLSMNHDQIQKDSRNSQQHSAVLHDQMSHVQDGRKFLTKSSMNRPPITSLIKKFEKEENEQQKETNEQPYKQTMLSTSTPITPRRPMTLHDEDDDNPPPLPPRYDTNSSVNKYGTEINTNQHFTLEQSDSRYQRTPVKPIHLRQNTGASDQDEGYKDRLRKVANSAVFDRYKPQNMTPNRQGTSQTPQYVRQGSNQSQFSQQSSLAQSTVSATPIRQQYGRQDDGQVLNTPSSAYSKQTMPQHTPSSQTRKAGLGRFANTGVYQSQSTDNRTSIHL